MRADLPPPEQNRVNILDMLGLALKKTWKELLSAQIFNGPFNSRGVAKSVGSLSVTTSPSAALSLCAPPEGQTQSQVIDNHLIEIERVRNQHYHCHCHSCYHTHCHHHCYHQNCHHRHSHHQHCHINQQSLCHLHR